MLEDVLFGEESMVRLLILLLCACGSNPGKLISPLIVSLESIWIVTRKYTHPVLPKECVAVKIARDESCSSWRGNSGKIVNFADMSMWFKSRKTYFPITCPVRTAFGC
jgi:hypothetical protein